MLKAFLLIASGGMLAQTPPLVDLGLPRPSSDLATPDHPWQPPVSEALDDLEMW
jgi:hypothetical protein